MPKESSCQILHPERPGGPCKVCLKEKPRYWHIGQALPRHAQTVINLRAVNCSDNDCICQACKKHHATDSEHSSKRGVKRSLSQSCAVEGCTNLQKLHQTNLISFPAEVLQLYGLDFSPESATPSTIIATLCHHHYCSIYNQSSVKHCTLCGSAKSCLNLCSNVSAARLYSVDVLQKEELKGEATFNLCTVCHASVTRYCKGQKFIAFNRSSKPYLSSLLRPFIEASSAGFIDSVDDFAFAHTLSEIGTALLNDKALLVQNAFNDYCFKFKEVVSSEGLEAQIASSHRSLHLFLSSVRSAIGECIITSCIQGNNRCGTMMRRYGTDLCTALHLTLYNQKSSQAVQAEPAPSTSVSSLWNMHLSDISSEINQNLSASARDIISQDRSTSYSLDTFDFVSEIKRIPAVVWNFVVACTQGTSELSATHFNSRFNWSEHFLSDTHPSEAVSRSKLMKRYFIVCSLLYTTNESCFSHLHMAISDLVDRFTSSSTLCFNYLSNFGITVSKSTFLRFQTTISKAEMNDKPVILSNSFCVASVDNIDRNSAYASVKVGQANRGFHGTSVQSVEPLPVTSSIGSAAGKSVHSYNRVGQCSNLSVDDIRDYQASSNQTYSAVMSFRNPFRVLSVSDFSLAESEATALSCFERKVFCYMLVKQLQYSRHPDIVMPDLKTCFTDLDCPTEKSTVHYISILPEPAESQQTILNVLDILYRKHQVGSQIQHLVVAGDCKTYDVILNLKRLYGEELDWVIPYLGEWHLLKNSQPPLMKLYSDAGLKTLLSQFHKGKTLQTVLCASGFKKTHHFLLQSWEALYRHILHLYISDESRLDQSFFTLLEKEIGQKKSNLFPTIFSSSLMEHLEAVYLTFKEFVQSKCMSDTTFQFWSNFCLRDMMFYGGLYMSIRSRDFSLRGACVRQMCPLFHAMDRTNYLRVVPIHIATLKTCPSYVLRHLEAGAFAVSLSGNHNQCVALDEAHEMCINKDMKMAMNATDPQGLNRLMHYLPFRSRVTNNLAKQVKPFRSSLEVDSANHSVIESNIRCYLEKLRQSKVFSVSDRVALVHLFDEKVASPLVTTDLTTFYSVGEADFISYVSCFIIAEASAKPSRKRRNLHTFADKKKTTIKKRQELKDHKLQIACLRKQVAWSKSNNAAVSSLNQFIPLPRAICDSDGIPNKGNKAASASFLQKRFPQTFCEKPCHEHLSSGGVCVIMEGMFMINLTRPLDCHKTFGDYASFLYKQWVVYAVRFLKASEVHIIFDHPGRHGVLPKDIERQRRDEHSNASHSDDCITIISSSTPKPGNWTQFISNRTQKRLLVSFLSHEVMQIAQLVDPCPGRLVTAGGFDGEHTDKASELIDGTVSFVPSLFSDHEEGDSRVWFHASKTTCKSIVIFSPDRDTFHIGLPFMQSIFANKFVYVQLRKQFRNDLFVLVGDICSSLLKDFDLQSLGDRLELAPSFLEMVFICSGCDYVSFFKGQSKLTFLKAFFRHAKFITGGVQPGLLLADSCHSEEGLYAFYRLIGSVYFQTHAGGFSEDNPEELFHSLYTPEINVLDHHKAFVSKIREGHFHRISDESYWMPSASALYYHWLRCCWTSQLWAQACSGKVIVPDVSRYGWKKIDTGLQAIWDTPENLSHIAEVTHFLKTGCKCKTGCSSKRCKCVRMETSCGPSCSCLNCKNRLETSRAVSDRDDIGEVESSSDYTTSESDSDVDHPFHSPGHIPTSFTASDSDSEDMY